MVSEVHEKKDAFQPFKIRFRASELSHHLPCIKVLHQVSHASEPCIRIDRNNRVPTKERQSYHYAAGTSIDPCFQMAYG